MSTVSLSTGSTITRTGPATFAAFRVSAATWASVSFPSASTAGSTWTPGFATASATSAR